MSGGGPPSASGGGSESAWLYALAAAALGTLATLSGGAWYLRRQRARR